MKVCVHLHREYLLKTIHKEKKSETLRNLTQN